MESSKSQARVTLAIAMIASFITPFMSNAVNLAIPAIGAEFGASQFMLNWIVSSFLLATAAFLLPFGRLADRYGRKRIFMLGSALLAVSSLACGLAPSLDVLLAFRVLQGIASAMVLSTSMAILTSVIPPETRGRALGLNSAATYIGLSCGPVLGGFISSTLSWRAVFYFNLLMAVVVIILTAVKLKGEWRGEVSKLDVGGMVFCIFAQALLLFGLTDLTAGPLYIVSFIVGVALLVAFFAFERRRKHALIPIEPIMKNRTFVFSNIATLINYSATFALSFMLSLFLQAVLHLDAGVSGLILLVQPVLMAALSPIAGILSDRMSSKVLASIGMAILTVGLCFFIFLSANTLIILIILNLAFMGIGFALFSTPNTNAIMGSVDKRLYGVASSFLGNMRVLGQAISMAIVGLITSFFVRDLMLGAPGYSDKLLASLKVAFIVFAVLCAVGVFASLVRDRRRGGASDGAGGEG